MFSSFLTSSKTKLRNINVIKGYFINLEKTLKQEKTKTN